MLELSCGTQRNSAVSNSQAPLEGKKLIVRLIVIPLLLLSQTYKEGFLMVFLDLCAVVIRSA